MSNEVSEHHLSVARTARYYTLGEPGATEVWFVCHGYGQLAGRFLRRFEPIADGSRLVVAPEGLNRFYVGSGEHRDQPVGATWMTREDRLNEIADYVKYLDAVYADVFGGKPTAARVRALGFSQGAATASRWVARARPASTSWCCGVVSCRRISISEPPPSASRRCGSRSSPARGTSTSRPRFSRGSSGDSASRRSRSASRYSTAGTRSSPRRCDNSP